MAERLRTTDESLIRIPEVCEATGVNYGSVYHHFRNRDAVIDAAYAREFSRMAEQDIAMLCRAVEYMKDLESFFEIIHTVIRVASDSSQRRESRLMRLRIIAVAQTRPELFLAIAEAQTSMTEQLEEVVQIAQERGFVNAQVPARWVAVLMQAVLFGRGLDSTSNDPMSDDDWAQMTESMVRNVLKPAE